jgi:hypothetical protein
MFETDMREKAECKTIVENMSFEAMSILIDFMYTRNLDKNWINYREEIINAAEMYGLPPILQIADMELIKTCKVGNAFELLQFARLFRLPTAVKNIKQFIKK